MGTATGELTARRLMLVAFTGAEDNPSQLDLEHAAHALDALRGFLDDCYLVMNPASILAAPLFMRRRGSTEFSSADKAYLHSIDRLRHSRHLESDVSRYVKWQLRLQRLPFWPIRVRAPSPVVVDIRRGSLEVVLDVGAWAAGGGLVGLFAALYLAQTHKARVRKSNATFEADAAEARLRLQRAQTDSLELTGKRLEKRLEAAGLDAEFELDAPETATGE